MMQGVEDDLLVGPEHAQLVGEREALVRYDGHQVEPNVVVLFPEAVDDHPVELLGPVLAPAPGPVVDRRGLQPVQLEEVPVDRDVAHKVVRLACVPSQQTPS